MPLLSRKADYALLILSHLHENPAGANARELADRFELSRPFVANILKELGHHGYVLSQRGVKGGYFLAQKVRHANLADLLEDLGEGFRLAQCNDHSHGESCLLEGVCPVKSPLAVVHQRMLAALRGITLTELLTPPAPANPATPAAMELLNLLPIRQVPSGNNSPTASVV